MENTIPLADDSEFREFITAGEAVCDNFSKYAQHTAEHQLGSVVDGLKLIHRRVLMTLGTRDTRIKVGSLAGNTMQDYHPHAPTAIEDTIVSLAQPFENQIPLIEAIGSVGTYAGDSAAAGRYLEAISTNFAKDLFFNKCSKKVLSYRPSDTGVGFEPIYLIPTIPTALLFRRFGIMIGYRTDTMPLNLNSLCDLTEAYIKLRRNNKHRDKKELANLAKYLLPDFPIPNLIRNSDTVIEQYASGNYSPTVIFDGEMVITNSSISIKTLPYWVKVAPMYLKAGEECECNKNSFFSKYFVRIRDLSGGIKEDNKHCNIVFDLKRGVDPFEILDEFKKKIRFTSSWSALPWYVTPEGKRVQCTPFDLIELWYVERYRSVLAELKITQNRLIERFRQLDAQIKICGKTKEVLKIIEQSIDKDTAAVHLSKQFDLTIQQAHYLLQVQLQQITKRGKEELIEAKEANKKEIEDLQEKFISVDQRIIDEVLYIKNTYGKQAPRYAKTPNFIAAVLINGTGVIQCNTFDKVDEVLNNFGVDKTKIIAYPSGSIKKYAMINGSFTDESTIDYPREFAGQQLFVTKTMCRNTICLTKKGDIYRLDGVVNSKDFSQLKDVKVIPVGENFIAIRKNGSVELIKATDIPLRKSVFVNGVKSDIIDIYPVSSPNIVVAYMSSSETNILRITKLTTNGKIVKPLLGTLTILEVCRDNDLMMINIPSELTKRVSLKFVLIKNFDYFKPGVTIKLDLYKKTLLDNKSTNNDVKLKPITKGSHIWVIE